MGRQLLEQLGFDPDEAFILTPDVACGAGILQYTLESGGLLPNKAEDMERIAIMANSDLIDYGQPGDATTETVKNALHRLSKQR